MPDHRLANGSFNSQPQTDAGFNQPEKADSRAILGTTQDMQLGQEACQNLDRALSLEWLEANGLGGFSSGTVSGANTRRYHALLLTVPRAENNRYVLVNHVEE
ncbi:MAG: glycogen debranching enzyme N-terminal domain-containing protein, partial [Nitrospira sp.]|nr:glycogen debranching enzyme N-terminal domain-containing protein [Nitrospira sp.]